MPPADAAFGSSRQLGVGPVAITSTLIGSGLANVVPGIGDISDHNDPLPEEEAIQAQYNTTVLQLAFVVSCMYTAVGVLRLGWLIRFLSHAVITGFTSGAAIIIASGQVGDVGGCGVGQREGVTWLFAVVRLCCLQYVYVKAAGGRGVHGECCERSAPTCSVLRVRAAE